MMDASDFKGLYAIIPTPAKDDAWKFGAKNTVDLAETERLVNGLLEAGVRGIIAAGTTGECATLSEADFRDFSTCVLETIGKRVPAFIGTTGLGSHQVAERLDFIKERGAEGTLLGLPMWQPCTTNAAVEFYQGASEYRPDLAIMVYANARAFRYSFPAEFWEGVAARARTATSAKFSRADNLAQLLELTGRRINFLPIDMAVHSFYEISPDTTTACWATAAAMGPEPSMAIMAAIARGDKRAIAEHAERIAWANETIKPIIQNPELFAQINIQVEKIRIEAAGYCRPGPIRSPYRDIPDEYAEASRECGERWRIIRDKYYKNS